MRKGLFTTGAGDNIDYDPSSKTSEDSFHGTGISLNQHPTKENRGTEQTVTQEEIKGDKLLDLPEKYTEIEPVSSFNREPKARSYTSLPTNRSEDLENILKEEERYVFKVAIPKNV